MTWYKLDENRKPVRCDAIESSAYMAQNGRRVAFDAIGRVEVSTVFLGLDHSYSGHTPLLFETMVFGMDDEIQERWTTWDEAEKGHKAVLEKVYAVLSLAATASEIGRSKASAVLAESKGEE
jgi:hypothetical protein